MIYRKHAGLRGDVSMIAVIYYLKVLFVCGSISPNDGEFYGDFIIYLILLFNIEGSLIKSMINT